MLLLAPGTVPGDRYRDRERERERDREIERERQRDIEREREKDSKIYRSSANKKLGGGRESSERRAGEMTNDDYAE